MSLEKTQTELDLEFAQEYLKAREEARRKTVTHISAAEEELYKAQAIAEEYGVELKFEVSPLTQIYRAKSLAEKWDIEKLDRLRDSYLSGDAEFRKLCHDMNFDIYELPSHSEGWQESRLCY